MNLVQKPGSVTFNPDTVHWNPLRDYDEGQLLEDCVRDKGGFK